MVVRVQALDGAWETLGADRARGVTPENVQLTSDQWGSKTAAFDLRRDPKAVWPDISAFAPVEVEVGGRLVWSGRVAETPVRDSTDSVISVQCEGWQAHLDDDLYERIYVHTNLSDYVDARSFLSADLTKSGTASGQVQAGDGGLILSFPKGTAMTGSVFTYAAAILDLGPGSLAKRVVFDAMAPARTTTWGRFSVLCLVSDSPVLFTDTAEAVLGYNPDITDLSTTATTTYAGSATVARRYVIFGVYQSGVTSFTTAEDNAIRISNIQVFTDTAYESGNVSVLKADQVVKDALDRATIKLSSDRTGVEAGTFNIPELAPSEPKTPREMWNAVDAFEDRYKKIDVEKRPIYKAKPSTPSVEVGAWSGMEFEDSSSNSGDDIYSAVIITGKQADGSPLRVKRTQADQAGNKTIAISTPSITNPSFASNAIGWSSSTGYATSTVTRDTATYDSSPASLRWDLTGASNALSQTNAYAITGTTSGSFIKGVTYTLSFAYKTSAVGTMQDYLFCSFGNLASGDYSTSTALLTTTSWATAVVTWTPSATTSSATVQFLRPSGLTSIYAWIDSLALTSSGVTVVERQGFARTKQVTSSFTLTAIAAQQIADKWLLSHKTSSFKGRAKLTGNQAIREIKTGRSVPPEEMLLRTGELVRFGDRIDPDTGAAGRDGRLVEAQYNADEDSVNLTIDSSRAGFEALLERLGVVLGQNRFS